MKVKLIIAAVAVSFAMATPVAAHHNCMASDMDVNGVCPEEIGDVMGMHEAAIEGTLEMMEDMTAVGDNIQTANPETGLSPEGVVNPAPGPAGQGSLLQ